MSGARLAALAGPAVLLALVAACSLPEAPATTSVPGERLPVPPGAQEAVVVRVSDGDTLRLRGRGTGPLRGGDTKVRVLLVDTPEVFEQEECFGPEASERTAALLPEGSTVRVEADEDLRDRFDRTLLHVWNEAGVNVGEALVAEGFATVLQVDPNRRYLEHFEAREDEARRAGRGLWSAC